MINTKASDAPENANEHDKLHSYSNLFLNFNSLPKCVDLTASWTSVSDSVFYHSAKCNKEWSSEWQIAHLSGSSNLTVAAEWKTIETSDDKSSISESLKPSPGSRMSPATGTTLDLKWTSRARNVSNNYNIVSHTGATIRHIGTVLHQAFSLSIIILQKLWQTYCWEYHSYEIKKSKPALVYILNFR